MKEVVSRAELKLLGAAEVFAYDFRGKIVLDIGSSTGGFTELALKKGASRVIAVEKGTKQMKVPLRFNPRVELHEKTDFLEVNRARNYGKGQIRNDNELVNALQVEIDLEGVQTAVADVSFVSLEEILAHAKKILPSGVDYLVMLKPQFEARPEQLNRGVVKNEKMRREIIKGFEAWLKKSGFFIVKKRDNELRGKVGGNQERFYWLKTV